MASLSFTGGRKGKGKRDRRIADVLFASLDGNKFKRPRIRLGRVTVEAGEEFRRNVERLIEARTTGCALGRGTAEWLATMPEKLYGKLVKCGLVDARPGTVAPPAVKLGPFLARYIGEREADAKASTLAVYERAEKRLVEHFGRDHDMAVVTVADALAYQAALRRNPALADNTVRKMLGIARQFWKRALKEKLVSENPFADSDVKTATTGNPSRQFFMDRALAARVMDAMPEPFWRVVFALSRFGGLRCPSEHFALKWSDVDWQAGRITVTSPKSEHHAGCGSRVIPLFPELRSELEAAFDPEAVYVLDKYRSELSTQLRTAMLRILRKAGIQPWPRLFHNLRASRQTELAKEGYPTHVVCAWLGNSQQIAAKHDLMVTPDMFDRASGQNIGQHPAIQGDTAGESANCDDYETSKNAGNTGDFACVGQSIPDQHQHALAAHSAIRCSPALR